MEHKWLSAYDSVTQESWLVYLPWRNGIINELAEFPTMYPYGKVEFKMSMFLTDFVLRYQPMLYSTTNMNIPPSVDTLKEAMEKVESFIEQYYEWGRKAESLNQF